MVVHCIGFDDTALTLAGHSVKNAIIRKRVFTYFLCLTRPIFKFVAVCRFPRILHLIWYCSPAKGLTSFQKDRRITHDSAVFCNAEGSLNDSRSWAQTDPTIFKNW